MKARMLIALAAVAAVPALVQAQGVSPLCPAGTSTAGVPDVARASQDACQKAIDLFQFLAPQLGVTIAGGNATLGVGGTIGGLGRVYISGRANVVSSELPEVNQVTVSTAGAQRTEFPTRSQIIGIPQVDAAIGLFRGFPVGITNVGGVDLLVNATYLPAVSSGGVDVRVPNGSLSWGGGVRVGIVQEGLLFPGLAVTYQRRSLPTVDVIARSANDTLRVTGIDEKTDSWRIVASKNVFLLGLAAGVGGDHYDSRSNVSAYVAPRALGAGVVSPAARTSVLALAQTLNRTTYFLDATLNFPVIHLIGEIGRTTSNQIATYNTFAATSAGAGRTYGAIGLRVGL